MLKLWVTYILQWQLGFGWKYQLQHKSTVYFATVWLSPLPKSLNFNLRLLIIRKLMSLQSNSQDYKIQKWHMWNHFKNYKNKTSSPFFLVLERLRQHRIKFSKVIVSHLFYSLLTFPELSKTLFPKHNSIIISITWLFSSLKMMQQ